MLLAPRKTALALMRRPDLVARKVRVVDAEGKQIEQELDVWITPPELVKQTKRAEQREGRTYITPLPPLAVRILKGLPEGAGSLLPLPPGRPEPEDAATDIPQ